MTSRDFVYWLQGYFEISTADAPLAALSPERVAMIKRHLSLVFKHEIDPSLDGGDPIVKAERQALHDGAPKSEGYIPYIPNREVQINWPPSSPLVPTCSC